MIQPDELVIEQVDGHWRATGGGWLVAVLGENGDRPKLYRRVHYRPFQGGRRDKALVAELNGVRCYIQGRKIILTTRKLM